MINVDVNNEAPAKKSKSFPRRVWNYLIAKDKPFRVWKPWEVMAATGTVALVFSFIGSLVAPRPDAPSDRDGRKYVVFQEIFQQNKIQEEQREMDSITMRKKIASDKVAQYKNGDSAMVAAVGQAHVKLKKLQARNDSIARWYKARNDSIAQVYKQIYSRRSDSIAKLEMAKKKMKQHTQALPSKKQNRAQQKH